MSQVLRALPADVRRRSAARRGPLPAGRLDLVLLLAVASLVGLGALLVWSATRQRLLAAGGDPTAFLQRHLVNAAVGTVLGAAVALVDHRTLRTLVPLVYVGAVAGLVAVLSPLGSTINGAHSWIVLPAGFQVQPSELAKVAVVVGMALVLAERRDGEHEPATPDVLLALGLAAVPAALVLLQPDLGTVLVLVLIALAVVALAGARARWLVGLLVAGVAVTGVAVHVGVLDDYQVDRFAAFADPALDPQGVGYNTSQARIAIGNGGLTGTGLFEGSQTRGQFIPEQQTDFVFTVAGEELGLVGGALLLVLLGVVLWRGLAIAARAPDVFGRVVAGGVVAWFAFQSFVNIGMTLGILPVTGLPLPFVSYGGSSMFACLVGVGLLQNVHLGSSAR
ncbi:MAG TPA: rod shape-determining protein RodA [Mycobacteriales bacterium]|nr:rod shape-determining protein RodA [Mycobacteriales bacterium]